MWPSLTGNQNDPEDTTDSSESLNSSVTTSIGVIGRKNLRADAPVFKTSSLEASYPTSYEAIGSDLTGALDHENLYGQETAIDYQPINDDRADFNSGCSTGFTPNSRYLTQASSPRNTGRIMMLQTPLPSSLTITQPPYNYMSPQHHQQSRVGGMSVQSLQEMHMVSPQNETPPRSPSHSTIGSGVSMFSPIAMNVYRDKQLQQQQQQEQHHSLALSPMTSFSREQQRLAQPLISADGHVYQVHFKRAHRNFLLGPSAPRNILPGDFVKVEADRGEDLGVVVSKSLVEDFVEFVPTAGYRGRGYSAGLGEKKYIIRFATAEERMLLRNKVEDEERTLQVIREKVIERRLPMAILDAEYQFDHHKLVYFFEADRRIDFRELVSDLFSLYKTRIWMQQVDTSTIPGEEVGLRLAHAAGFLPSSYMSDGGCDLRDMDELSQTVSEFAAGQVLQVDDEIHQDLYRDRERERDRDRDAYAVTASASPSHHRVDRVRSGSGTGSSSHCERESNLLTITGDLPHDHKLTSKALFMSQLGYGSYGSGCGVTGPGTGSGVGSGMGLNIIDDEEISREKRRERRGEYGGSMGPLLNGAWAYEH